MVGGLEDKEKKTFQEKELCGKRYVEDDTDEMEKKRKEWEGEEVQERRRTDSSKH